MEVWEQQKEIHKLNEKKFLAGLDSRLRTLALMFAHEGDNIPVQILTYAKTSATDPEYDNYNGGIYCYTLKLEIAPKLFFQIEKQKEKFEELFGKRFSPLNDFVGCAIGRFQITPEIQEKPEWRDDAKRWLSGEGVNNQGRVRSDNIASRECDGLLFRSQPEINLYKALKAVGVSFAPLPVFVHGGEKYQRIEPDFLVLKDGILLVVEVDGDTFHTELPAEAQARINILELQGAKVQHIKASKCDTDEKAKGCAQEIVGIIEQLKNAK